MIEGRVYCNDELLMRRLFNEADLTLEAVAEQLQLYVQEEQLNLDGDCELRIRFLGRMRVPQSLLSGLGARSGAARQEDEPGK